MKPGYEALFAYLSGAIATTYLLIQGIKQECWGCGADAILRCDLCLDCRKWVIEQLQRQD